MTKNILFLVTGMTPQIITETIWALACDPDNSNIWIPDEIHVLSTEDGLNQIRSRLFSQKEGFKFQQFKQEFSQVAHVAFDDSDTYLHVICDEQDNILKDLKTPEDNELAANLICQMVREFTQDDDVVLHVSIAGGRKTMGFYAGYALSLYGRAQDRMSHVLVEERYESARDFFYPSADETVFVTNRDGIELKAKDAQIWLADIPFVRMREAIVDNHILHPKHHHKSSFSNIVDTINKSFAPLTLTLHIKERKVQINDEKHRLDPLFFALLHWFAKCHQQSKGIIVPTVCLVDVNNNVEFFSEWSKPFNECYALQKASDDKVVDKDFFEQMKSKAKSRLIKLFSNNPQLIDKIMPVKNYDTGTWSFPTNLTVKIES